MVMPHSRSSDQTLRCPDDSGHRHQKVLGEQLAVGQQQRDEADGERGTGEQVVVGVVLDHEIGQHAGADIQPTEQPGADQREQRPRQPLVTLLDQPVKRLIDGPIRLPVLAGAQQPASDRLNRCRNPHTDTRSPRHPSAPIHR